MYHFRSTKRVYNKLNLQDKKPNQSPCSFPSCDDKSTRPAIEQNKTMHVIENRVTYDIFEGRRVLEHLMVIPLRHVEALADFTQQENSDYMALIAKYEKQGYNIYARAVDSKTRSVKHQHTHLIKLADKPPKSIFYLRKPYFLMYI